MTAPPDRYRDLVEHTSDFIQSIGTDGRILFTNRAFLAALGYTSAKLSARTVFDILDAPSVPHCRVIFARLLAGADVGAIDVTFRSKHGSAIPLEGRASVQLEHGIPIATRGIFRDVREQRAAVAAIRRSEERLSLALRGSRLALWDFDLPSGMVHLGHEWARLSDAPPRDTYDLPILALQALVHPDDLAPLRPALVATLKGLQPDISVDHRIKTAGGAWKWVNTHGMVTERDTAGRAPRMTGTTADIDARKRAEEALRDARLAAEAADRAKGAFLATVSHEIRTPMHAITGMLDLLARTSLDAEQSQLVAVLRESAGTLLQIVDDVLEVSRIESGQFSVRPEPASLEEVIEAAVRTFEGSAERKGLDLRLTVDPDIAPRLAIDPLRLNQIVFNLLGNAIKFTDRGHVDVRVRRLRDTDGIQTVRLDIEDTGIGVAADDQNRLFHPFVQAGPGATPAGGTGLGLVIARRLAELMGGTLTMTSTPGRGTTMTVLLDAAIVASAPVASAHATPQAAASARIRVLVVDDDELNRVIVSRQLATLGIAADLANNGEEALRYWERTPYPLIVCDCQMPVMDGYTLARRIRAAEQAAGGHHRTPIVAYTANGSHDDGLCYAAGIDAVLAKPVNLATMTQAVRRWLPQPAAADAAVRDAVDVARLAQITGGDLGLERDLLRMFQARRPLEIEALGTALDAGDWAGVSAIAHRLTGAAHTIAAEPLAAACANLERAARQRDPDAIARARSATEDAFARLAAFLETHDRPVAPPEPAAADGHPPRSSLSRLAVPLVDDDEIQRAYVRRLLTRIGVSVVLDADSAGAALEILGSQGSRVDVIVCDLELPDMDGMNLLRVIASRGRWPSVIVTSAADPGRLKRTGFVGDRIR